RPFVSTSRSSDDVHSRSCATAFKTTPALRDRNALARRSSCASHAQHLNRSAGEAETKETSHETSPQDGSVHAAHRGHCIVRIRTGEHGHDPRKSYGRAGKCARQ